MVYHTAAAARGIRRALLIADMPFLSARDAATGLSTARRLMSEGGAAYDTFKSHVYGRPAAAVRDLMELAPNPASVPVWPAIA